jgi:CRP-like cAMP-binding protein
LSAEPAIGADLGVFSPLPPDTAAAIVARGSRRSYRRGDVIFHKGDPSNTIYMVVQGRAKILLPGDERKRVVLRVLERGDLFGEQSLFDGSPRAATVVAAELTDVLAFDRHEFLGLLQTHPQLALELLRVLSQRLRDANGFIEDTVFLDVAARLAKKLLELSEAYGRDSMLGTIIALRITQHDLAAMLGVTRESVNKHLQAYRARGIIDFDRQRIVILRPSELQRRIY